jgi:hypothetical protein
MPDGTQRDVASWLSTRLFSFRELLKFALAFVVIEAIAVAVVKLTCAFVVTFNCPISWPMNVFVLATLTPLRFVTALGVAVLFAATVWYLSRTGYRFSHVVVAGIVLVLASNLIQGWQMGLYTPISGRAVDNLIISRQTIPIADHGQQYYHQALRVSDPADFLRSFNQLQKTWAEPDRAFESWHVYTHPPGAVLIFYWLAKLLGHPGWIAVFIAVVSLVSSAYFFRKLLLREVDESTTRYVTFLWVLLPAVQIYSLATLDALVASLLTATLYFFTHPDGRRLWGAFVCLTASFLLTFGTMMLLPLLAGYEWIRRRSVKRTALLGAGVAGIHLVIYAGYGYDPVAALREGSAQENREGFMLFAEPANYFFTRLMDVGEILFFFGPFLIVLLVRGFRAGNPRTSDLFLLPLLAAGSFVAFILTGALKSGETARVVAFIYPYLLFPVAAYLQSFKPTLAEKTQLASLVFAQTVAMQLLGHYFW